MLSAKDVIERLGLKPLPLEGGFFRGTYKADGHIPEESLPAGTGGPSAFCTAIYYLLTPETFSAIHRLPLDRDYGEGKREELLRLYPAFREEIMALTRMKGGS